MCARDRLYDDDEKNRYKSRQRRERKGKKTVQLQSLPGKNRERKEKKSEQLQSPPVRNRERNERRKKKRKKIRIRSESKSENPNFSEVFLGSWGTQIIFIGSRLNRHPFWLLSHPQVAAATPPILFYCQIQAFDLPKCIMREKQRLIDLLITN